MTDEARPLREVLGDGARRVREAAGLRQEDIARRARDHGLSWDRSRIAALERGEKAVSAEELAILPLVYTRACGRHVGLAELTDVSDTERVNLSPRVEMSGRALQHAYSSQDLRQLPVRELYAIRNGPSLPSPAAVTAMVERLNELTERLMALGLAASGIDLENLVAEGQTVGEAERKAAERLAEDPVTVLALSRALWGCALTTERDRRVDERMDVGDDAGRRRAIRGRLTRQLVDQLRDEISRRTERGTSDEDQD